MNPKEALVFFLPIILIFGAFCYCLFNTHRIGSQQRKQSPLRTRQTNRCHDGANIGCEKAYKIANELPECAYRDGYVEGIASIEDAMQRNM